MSKLDQSTRLATLHTPLGEDALFLRALHVTERLGRLYALEIEADSEQGDIKADDLLGLSIHIEIASPTSGEPRFFHGLVSRFSHSPRAGRRYYRYHLTAVPRLWMLTRQADCRIYQNQSIPQIIKDVFSRNALLFEDHLQGTYSPLEYCVQYRETSFNFVSRLMEKAGIYYYFKHTAEDNILNLVDAADAHQPFPGYDAVILKARSGAHGQEDEVLREWNREHSHHSGAFAQRDYDFTRPLVDLTTQKTNPGEFALESYEVYDYPGEYLTYGDGEARAGVRMEEIRAERVVYHTGGNVVGLAVGHKFSLTGPPGFKDEGDYLVIGSAVHLKTAVYQTGDNTEDGDSEEAFTVSAELIQAAEPFRPARLTPKPILQGVQTAVVTGPKGEEIHTDKYGRIKVQFHWDRLGKLDENTTLFIRVGQVWAGKRWGATFIPRIGQEVIVAFLEGDPDQPIVVGSVYNGDQMPPYLGEGPDPKHKHDPNVSGIKSESTKGGAGFNELRFDDKKGSEEIFLHAEKNLDTRVKNDTMETIGNSRFLTVGSEKDGAKTGDQFEMVMRNKHLKVHKDQEEIIGGVQKLHVGGIDGGAGDQDIVLDGNRHVLVGKDDHLHVKGDRKQKVDGGTSLTVGGDQQEKVGQNHALDAGQEIHLKAGTKVIIEAGTQISLKVGGNFVDIGPAGVTIVGTMVKINSGGAAGSGKGSSPEAPADPAEAAPTLPTLADDSKPGFLSSSSATPAPAAPVTPAASAPAAGGKMTGGGPGIAAPKVPGMPAMPDKPVTPGFFNCVKNAAKKAEEAIDQGKKTVDEATKAVKAAEDTADKVEADVKAVIQDVKDEVADVKGLVQDVKDTVNHLKKAASEGSFSEVKAAVKSGKDAVDKAKDGVKKAKDAVAKAKDAVQQTEAGVKAAVKGVEDLVDNVKATLDKTGDAFKAAGECL